MTKIAFLGNCQATSLYTQSVNSEAVGRHFYYSSFDLSSKVTIGEIKGFLLDFISAEEYARCISEGFIKINPSLKDVRSFAPDTLVVTFFHEGAYYKHKTLNFTMSVAFDMIDPSSKVQEFQDWVRENFDYLSPNPKTYYERFHDFLSKITVSENDADLILVKRLSESIVPGEAISWLKNWGDLEHGANEFIQKCASDFGARTIDADDYINGMIESSRNFSDHFNLMASYTLKTDRLDIQIAYDIEHLPLAVWWEITSDVLRLSCGSKITPAFETVKDSGFIPTRRALMKSVVSGNKDEGLHLLHKLIPNDLNFLDLLVAIATFKDDHSREQIKKLIADTLSKELRSSGFHELNYAKRVSLAIAGHDSATLADCKGRKVVLWGAGGRAEFLLENSGLFDELDIACILDGSMDKHGSSFFGLEVVHPSLYKEDADVVIVTSSYYQDVTLHGKTHPGLSSARFIDTDPFLFKHFLENGQYRLKMADSG